MKFKRFMAVLLAAAVLLVISGCNQATSPRNAVERFEAAMNDNDFREAFLYVYDYDGFGFSDGAEEIVSAVARSLKIKIIDEVSGPSSATVTADITTVDLREVYCDAAAAVIPQYYSAAISGAAISESEVGEQMIAEVVSLSGKADAPTVTTRVALNVVTDKNGKWVIRLDTAAYNALTGYLDEANNLITTGTITQALSGETDFLSGLLEQPTTNTSASDVSGTDTQ